MNRSQQPRGRHATHPDTRRQRGEELRCVDCELLTTRVEAEDRIFNTGRCGNCSGQLIAASQCGRKSRVEGKTFLCIAEWGHGGSHRYAVTVAR